MELAIWGLGVTVLAMIGLLIRAQYDYHRLKENAEARHERQVKGLQAEVSELNKELFELLIEWNNLHEPGEIRYLLLGDGAIQKQVWQSGSSARKWWEDKKLGGGKRKWVDEGLTMSKKEADADIEMSVRRKNDEAKTKKNMELRKTIPAKQYWP